MEEDEDPIGGQMGRAEQPVGGAPMMFGDEAGGWGDEDQGAVGGVPAPGEDRFIFLLYSGYSRQ